VEVHRFGTLRPDDRAVGMARGDRFETDELVIGEWSLTAAARTDRHQHDEINRVLEGELHVTSDGATVVVRPGEVVCVPAGSLARYAAPIFAKMMFVYGPSTDGHAAADTSFEQLGEPGS
jgi:ethanolamine utilization protein EutQ (cupin superfamily)